MEKIDEDENEARMARGELYYAFTPRLTAARDRCHQACHNFNMAGFGNRRRLVELLRDILGNKQVMPPVAPTPEEEEALFQDDPWIDGPIKVDYGTNLRIGSNVQINMNCTFLDTCLITIGSGTLVGPNCSFYSATHPVDPFVRNGTKGPEMGAPITIGEDCWIGGNVTVCPGVTISRGSTVGAGSVVTKDVPAFHVVVGNPARILRKIDISSQDLAKENGS